MCNNNLLVVIWELGVGNNYNDEDAMCMGDSGGPWVGSLGGGVTDVCEVANNTGVAN